MLVMNKILVNNISEEYKFILFMDFLFKFEVIVGCSFFILVVILIVVENLFIIVFFVIN